MCGLAGHIVDMVIGWSSLCIGMKRIFESVLFGLLEYEYLGAFAGIVEDNRPYI